MLFDKENLQKEINESINYLQEDIKKIGTGRASSEMIGNVLVEAYGGTNKLNTLGQVIIEDAVTAKVSVWDKSIIQAVDKALREANLGGSVAAESDFIRIKFNPMTEEDRRSKVKELNKMIEEGKIRIRLIRQKYIKKVEDLEGVSEDEQKRDKESIQKIIDQTIASLEEIANKKESEILSI